MLKGNKTVFISYRRKESSYVARSIFKDLVEHDYNVFMDVESLDSGTFDTKIKNEIAARAHFLIVLGPDSMKGFDKPKDWLRQEIKHAIILKRNVVPIFINGFSFAEIKPHLTGILEKLPRYNALPLYHEYFDAGMLKLRERFLNDSVDALPSYNKLTGEKLDDLTRGEPLPRIADHQRSDGMESEDQTEVWIATAGYERWLAQHTTLVQSDLKLKHALMNRDASFFFKATFYRWIEIWPRVCPELEHCPLVLAVGDLHVENFGTWRDREGRLIWGINDFDEAHPLPYASDLVRLATSVKLAVDTEHLVIKPKHAYDAILTGYMEGLTAGGQPFVLAERHQWLHHIATSKLRDPVMFWRKMDALPPVKGTISKSARAALDHLMPDPALSYSLRRRVSGLGSLGRPRYVAIATWHGGKIARETKKLTPSACVWARDGRGVNTIMYQSVLDQAVRCCDPFVQLQGGWLVRRLSPYCSRIALTSLPKKRDEGRLLYAMGWETANVHLGSRKAIKAVQQDVSKRKADWLRMATKQMTTFTINDWRDWGQGTQPSHNMGEKHQS